MIPFLSPLFAQMFGGLPRWLTDFLAIAALVGAIIGGWSLWLHFHDKGIIADHEETVQADVIDATSEASAEADAAAAEYESGFGKRQDQNRKEIDNAKLDGSSPFDSWNADAKRVPPAAGADRKAAR